jgi:hypothetical protein
MLTFCPESSLWKLEREDLRHNHAPHSNNFSAYRKLKGKRGYSDMEPDVKTFLSKRIIDSSVKI